MIPTVSLSVTEHSRAAPIILCSPANRRGARAMIYRLTPPTTSLATSSLFSNDQAEIELKSKENRKQKKFELFFPRS
jgi:hypothetical protein